MYHRRVGLSSETSTSGRGFWYNIPAMASHIPPKNMLFACFSAADLEDTAAPEMPASFLPDRESPALCQYDLAELVESYARRIILPLFPVSPLEALKQYNDGDRRIVPAVPHLASRAGRYPSMSVEGLSYGTVLEELVSYLINLVNDDVASASIANRDEGKPHGSPRSYNPKTWFADPDIWSTLTKANRREDGTESLAVTRHFPRKTGSWGKFTLHVNRARKEGEVPEHGMDFPLIVDRIVDTETVKVNLGPDLGSIRLPKDSLIWAYDGDDSRLDNDGHMMLNESFRASDGPEDDKTRYDEGSRLEGGAYLPLLHRLTGGNLPDELHRDEDLYLTSDGRRYYAELGPHAYESKPVSPGNSQYIIPESAGLPYAYSSLPRPSVHIRSDHVVCYSGYNWKISDGFTYLAPRPWGTSAKSYWDVHQDLKDTSGLPQSVAHLWREPLPLGAFPNTATGTKYDVARTPVTLSPALLTRADARVDPSRTYVDAVTQTPGELLSVSRTNTKSIVWFPDSLNPRTLLDELYRWRDEHLRATVTVVDMAVAESAAFDRKSAHSTSTATDTDHQPSQDSEDESYTWHQRSASGKKVVEKLEAKDFAVVSAYQYSQVGSPYSSQNGGALRLGDLLRASLSKASMFADGLETYWNDGTDGAYDETSRRTMVEATAEEIEEETGSARVSGLTPVREETVSSGGLGGGTMKYGSGSQDGNVDMGWRDDDEDEPDMSADGMTADPEMSYTEQTSGRHLPLIPDWMAPAILRAELYVVVRAENNRVSSTMWTWYEAGNSGEVPQMLNKDIGDTVSATATRTTILKLSEYSPDEGRFTGSVTKDDADSLYPPLPEQVWAGNTPEIVKTWCLAGDGMRLLDSAKHRDMFEGTHGWDPGQNGQSAQFTGSYAKGVCCANEVPHIDEMSNMLLVVEWDFDTPLPLDGSPASCMEYLLDARRRLQQALEALAKAEERKDEAGDLFDEVDASDDFTYIRDQVDLNELERSCEVRVVWSDDAPFADSGAAKAWAELQEAAGPEATNGLEDDIDDLRDRVEKDSAELEATIAELEEEAEDPEYEDDPSRCKPLWTRAGTDLADARKLQANAVRMLRDAKREEGALKAESALIVARYESLRSSNHPNEWRPFRTYPVWMYDAEKDVSFTLLGTMESVLGVTGDSRQVMGVQGAYWVVMGQNLALYLSGDSDASALPSPEMADVPLWLLGQLG